MGTAPAAIGVRNAECGVRNEILRYAQNDTLFVLQKIFFIYNRKKVGIFALGVDFWGVGIYNRCRASPKTV